MRVLWLLAVAALLVGCEQSAYEHPFPPEPPNMSYRISKHQFFESNDPAGLMRLTRDENGNPTGGSIVGKIHGWPFPHSDRGGDSGEGLFDYRTEFTVIRIGQDQLPQSAQGTRTVYFNSERPRIPIAQLETASLGQPVIRESVDLRFSFQNPETVVITISSRQKAVAPFEWQGVMRTPPAEPPETYHVTAAYARQYDGYLFR